MVPTGCASAAVISACTTAQHPFAPRVLPAYGHQDSRSEEQNHWTKSNPNTTCPPLTLGGNHGPGHFYMAENRTFLLCVDRNLLPKQPGLCPAGSTSLAFATRRACPRPCVSGALGIAVVTVLA